MPTITVLKQLIGSLSKTEKRYFKLHSSLQKGPKEYLHLFRLLEQPGQLPLKKAFLQQRPRAAYEPTVKHLYKVLTDSLLRSRMEQDKAGALLTGLLKANIFFEKSLYPEGFRQLRKIQAEAEKHEQYLVQLRAARLELYYLSNLHFHEISEGELIRKQTKIQEILRYIKSASQHAALYELLRHRLVYKGNIRSEQQKKELNDLLVTEINLAAGPVSQTFETHKVHLLFQAQYFIATNDYASALKTFRELNDLLEEHRHLWIDSPIEYLSSIEGILESLRAIRRYEDMRYFIDKLQPIKNKSAWLGVMIERIAYIYGIAGLLARGAFKKAIGVQEKSEKTLFKKLAALDADKQAEVWLYTALIYFGNNDFDRAHQYLGKVLLDSDRYHSLPIYQTFRLIRLLVHYELGNHDFIFHEIRSVRRTLKNTRNKTYKLENILFRFIQLSPKPATAAEGMKHWPGFKAAFDQIAGDRYEMQILQIFDFPAWIEARLCKKDFSTLLRTRSDSPPA